MSSLPDLGFSIILCPILPATLQKDSQIGPLRGQDPSCSGDPHVLTLLEGGFWVLISWHYRHCLPGPFPFFKELCTVSR